MEQINCYPTVVWLSLVDFCNNRCLWCYEQCNEVLGQKIDVARARIILRVLKETGVKKCVIIGGEPTLHPDFFEILRDVKKCGMYVSVVTNGRVFFQKNIANQLQAVSPDYLTISVHGWSEESYLNLARSKTGFSEVEKSMRNFTELGIRFDVNITLSKYTAEHIDEIINFLTDHNVTSAGFNLATASVSQKMVVGDCVPSLPEFRDQVLAVFRGCQKRNIRSSFLLTIPQCIFSEEELVELFEAKVIACSCQLLHGNGIVIQADSAISLCNHLLDFKVANVQQSENIFSSKEKFLAFWNSVELISIRKHANCFRSLECSKCNHWEVCGAGCFVRWAHYCPSDVNFKAIDIKSKLNKA